ncbi:MAG: respiratory nitrate reductase subunit gamma [Deltaproteobacteria bacterium]|nr:MAG: respiratory nitrate reductase subunit gamma [Deltaproteobacteria bacterium]
MHTLNTLAFLVFPYLALTTSVVGHLYRYISDPYGWNTRSSELLEKKGLKFGITIFHWGIIFTLLGHGVGLLIPQRYWDAVGIDSQTHTVFATYSGALVGAAALLGLCLLIYRRITKERILATTSLNDFVTLGLLFFVVATGTANVFSGLYEHFDILTTVAPWLRGILTLTPDPTLMLQVPLRFKLHILGVLTLIGFWPFSRLVHIWSVPLTYFFRRWIVFRRREISF